MQLAAAGIQHALVCHLLDQRVAECVHALGLDPLERSHVGGVEPRQLAQQRLLVEVLDRLEHAERDALADHGGQAQHSAAALVELVDTCKQQAVQAVG